VDYVVAASSEIYRDLVLPAVDRLLARAVAESASRALGVPVAQLGAEQLAVPATATAQQLEPSFRAALEQHIVMLANEAYTKGVAAERKRQRDVVDLADLL